jgi:hypothetical protein
MNGNSRAGKQMTKNSTIAVSLGERSQNLPAVTKAKKAPKKAGTMTKATAKEINAVAEYQQKPYGEESLAYMPSQLVQHHGGRELL